MIVIEWAPLTGAFVGAMVGLTGVGGGTVLAPLLWFVFGVDLLTVIATCLLFETITKTVSLVAHRRKREIGWPVVQRLWIGSIPATFCEDSRESFTIPDAGVATSLSKNGYTRLFVTK